MSLRGRALFVPTWQSPAPKERLLRPLQGLAMTVPSGRPSSTMSLQGTYSPLLLRGVHTPPYCHCEEERLLLRRGNLWYLKTAKEGLLRPLRGLAMTILRGRKLPRLLRRLAMTRVWKGLAMTGVWWVLQ